MTATDATLGALVPVVPARLLREPEDEAEADSGAGLAFDAEVVTSGGVPTGSRRTSSNGDSSAASRRAMWLADGSAAAAAADDAADVAALCAAAVASSAGRLVASDPPAALNGSRRTVTREVARSSASRAARIAATRSTALDATVRVASSGVADAPVGAATSGSDRDDGVAVEERVVGAADDSSERRIDGVEIAAGDHAGVPALGADPVVVLGLGRVELGVAVRAAASVVLAGVATALAGASGGVPTARRAVSTRAMRRSTAACSDRASGACVVDALTTVPGRANERRTVSAANSEPGKAEGATAVAGWSTAVGSGVGATVAQCVDAAGGAVVVDELGTAAARRSSRETTGASGATSRARDRAGGEVGDGVVAVRAIGTPAGGATVLARIAAAVAAAGDEDDVGAAGDDGSPNTRRTASASDSPAGRGAGAPATAPLVGAAERATVRKARGSATPWGAVVLDAATHDTPTPARVRRISARCTVRAR